MKISVQKSQDLSFFIKNGIEYYGGTFVYMAPEIIKGEQYNKEVDIYSFGIMLYEIATDSPPFPEFDQHRITICEFHNKIANENYRPVFREPINKRLQELIEQCWSADPKNRPTIDEVLIKLANPDNFLDNVDQVEVEIYLEDLLYPGTNHDN